MKALELIAYHKQRNYSSIIAELYHVFMIKYGYIPLEDFKRLPIVTAKTLQQEIERDAKREKEEMDKIRRR